MYIQINFSFWFLQSVHHITFCTLHYKQLLRCYNSVQFKIFLISGLKPHQDVSYQAPVSTRSQVLASSLHILHISSQADQELEVVGGGAWPRGLTSVSCLRLSGYFHLGCNILFQT